MTALAAGHFGTDFAGGALPGLLPFLTDEFGLSYTLTAALMLASAASSSLVQPALGLWSDRHGALWLLPTGVALAGVGIALAAAASSYWVVFALVVVSGLGTAAYHPEGSKVAAYVSGHRRASGMSAFSIGGNVGFALGPLVATSLVVWFGLRGGLLVMVPCLAIAGMLLALTPFLRTFVPDRKAERAAAGENKPGALALLLAIIGFRSLAWFGLLTFVPLWEVSLGHSEAYGSHLLTLMLLVGGIGTILVGPAADRLGRRPVLIVSLGAAGPLILAFVVVGGVVGAVALALAGISIVGTFGLTMVMSQEYLPRSIGVASGLSTGFAIGLGGVAAVGLGAIADAVDLETALYVSAAAPVVGLLLTLLLPATRERRTLETEVAFP